MTEKPRMLTPDAEEAFLEIGQWTNKTFGWRQADAYMGELIDTCRRIAAGTAITKDCRSMFDLTLPEDLLSRVAVSISSYSSMNRNWFLSSAFCTIDRTCPANWQI